MIQIIQKWIQILANHLAEICWFVCGLTLLLLTIFVNPWFSILMIYGMILKISGYQPLYFIFGSDTRKIPVGRVIDSQSGKPLELAVVRLYDQKTKKLLQTKVTNKDGLFDFLLPSGAYFIQVTKKGYKHPASKDLGQIITITQTQKYAYVQEEIRLIPARFSMRTDRNKVKLPISETKLTPST